MVRCCDQKSICEMFNSQCGVTGAGRTFTERRTVVSKVITQGSILGKGDNIIFPMQELNPKLEKGFAT